MCDLQRLGQTRTGYMRRLVRLDVNFARVESAVTFGALATAVGAFGIDHGGTLVPAVGTGHPIASPLHGCPLATGSTSSADGGFSSKCLPSLVVFTNDHPAL